MAEEPADLGAQPVFHERVRLLGGRMRKTTIVARARKLLIALWRYTTAGVVIEGAVMKAAPATI
jgi:transposase